MLVQRFGEFKCLSEIVRKNAFRANCDMIKTQVLKKTGKEKEKKFIIPNLIDSCLQKVLSLKKLMMKTLKQLSQYELDCQLFV